MLHPKKNGGDNGLTMAIPSTPLNFHPFMPSGFGMILTLSVFFGALTTSSPVFQTPLGVEMVFRMVATTGSDKYGMVGLEREIWDIM